MIRFDGGTHYWKYDVKHSAMKILADDLITKADWYRSQFETAKPFCHVLITPFFQPALAEAMLQEFPVPLESQMRGEAGEKCRKFALPRRSMLTFVKKDITTESMAMFGQKPAPHSRQIHSSQ
jgi:hypothetical protein